MVLFAAAENDIYFAKLKDILSAPKNDQQLFKAIVNAPFDDKRRAALLGLGIVVLLLGGGIGCSFVYPFPEARHGGALIFSYYITLDKIGREHHEFMRGYSRLTSKSL
jgi:hypothetical protein